MPLEDGHGPLGVVIVVVGDKVVVGHALLLFDVDGGLDDLSETRRVCVACLEGFGYHVGSKRGLIKEERGVTGQRR